MPDFYQLLTQSVHQSFLQAQVINPAFDKHHQNLD